MSDIWYYATGSEPIGPVSKKQLIDALSRLPGTVNALVWCDGFVDWTKASEVADLISHVAKPPPLPPTRNMATNPPNTGVRADNVTSTERQFSPSIPTANFPLALFSVRGRYNRAQYALTVVSVLFVTLVAEAISDTWRSDFVPFTSLIVVLTAIWIHIAAAIKRFHDMNRSGYSVFVFVIPLVNLYIGLMLLFCPGDEGSNKYGPSAKF